MTLDLVRCRVLFPDWYDELAEVVAEHKGWLPEVRVELADGRRVPVHFYDPVRLAQDLEEDVKWGRPCIAEPGLIVVPTVTREAIRQAVAYLSGTDYFDHLRDESRMTPQRGEATRHTNGVPTDTLGAA